MHQRFRHRLTLEDAQDVAGEAFAQAVRHLRAGTLPSARGEIDLWLKKAAYHRALDAIRARRGEARTPRPTTVPLNELADAVRGDDDEDPVATGVEAQLERETNALWLRDALDRLPSRERRALRLRHLRMLPVSVCAERLGVSRWKFERIHTRAMKRLRSNIAATQPTAACPEIRQILGAPDTNGPAQRQSDAVDAHLAGCLPCRVFAMCRAEQLGVRHA